MLAYLPLKRMKSIDEHKIMDKMLLIWAMFQKIDTAMIAYSKVWVNCLLEET